MSKKKLGPGVYTRGWETFAHYLSMLRSSLKMHLFFSLACGLVIGSMWFYFGLEKQARGKMSGYLKAAALSLISQEKSAEYYVGGGVSKVPSGQAYTYFKENIFKGRTFGFLARQWVFRILTACIGFLFVSALFMISRGRKLSKDEHRRGAKVVDVNKLEQSRKRRAFFALTAASLLACTVLSWAFLGTRGRAHLADYLWSSVYISFSPMAALASQDFEGKTAWYDSPLAKGFQDNQDVHDKLRKEVFSGRSAAYLVLEWFATVSMCFASGLLFLRYRKRRKEAGMGLGLAGVSLPVNAECSHFLFTGAPGSGKSTAIKEILDQVRKRGERAIVYDPSGEYIEPYYRKGIDVIMNPLDARSELWTLWADAKEKTDYATIARSLFPVGGKDPFWNDAGAALFAAAAEKLSSSEPSNKRLYELLTTASIQELSQFLKGTSATKFLDPGAGAMPANLIATVTSKLAAWNLLTDPDGDDGAFSIRSFIENERKSSWMFLAMRQDHYAALRPLISLWCEIAATAILSLPPSASRRIWVVLDEVASLQRLPALQPLLAQGRKHGSAVVLGLQSIPQLRDSYGRDGAAALASQPQTWLALRTVEPDTARWLEQALGEAEIEETREGVSMGADDIRDGVTINQNLRKSSAAMAAEIMNLPDLEGFLKMPGDRPVYRVKLDVTDRRRVADIYIPREKTNEGKEKKNDEEQRDSDTEKPAMDLENTVPYPFRSSGPHVRYLREKASKR